MPSHCVLVVGAGGREHALAWRLAQDPETSRVLITPGHDGAARAFPRLGVAELDAEGLIAACRAEGVTLAVIGPEAPLAAGVADALTAAGVPVFGASAAAARLEASKWFAKEIMAEAGVPTAGARAFEDLAAARAALALAPPPFVLKADGLAAGKGVLVTRDRKAAERFLSECLESGRFGAGGQRVVLEEFLDGEEASVIAVCDGQRFVLLPAARDYKRAFDGDAGPNTGGMGAVAPTAAVTPALEGQIARRIVAPMLAAMAARGTPFRGALYCGLMIRPDGDVRVVEFNARFGDPETQAILPLLGGSLTRLLASAAHGALEPDAVSRSAGACVAIALADTGYPDAVEGGGTIDGLDELERLEHVHVFHAGTRLEDGRWRVRGGRAATVVATAGTPADARDRAYAAVGRLRGSGWRFRSDVAREPEGGAGAADTMTTGRSSNG